MAKNVSVTWLQKKQFVGVGSSKRSVVMSGQDEENAIGYRRPKCCCWAWLVFGLRRGGHPGEEEGHLDRLEVKVSAEQEADPPWPYRQIHLEYILRGKGLTDKNVADAIHLSETKYCSVAATIRPTAEITTSYQIIEDE